MNETHTHRERERDIERERFNTIKRLHKSIKIEGELKIWTNIQQLAKINLYELIEFNNSRC